MATITFNNTTSDSDLGNALNWDALVLPTSGDDAVIAANFSIGTVSCDNIEIDQTGSGATFIAGISITITLTSGTIETSSFTVATGLYVFASGFTLLTCVLNGNPVTLNTTTCSYVTFNNTVTLDGSDVENSIFNAPLVAETDSSVIGNNTYSSTVDATSGAVNIIGSPTFLGAFSGTDCSFYGGTPVFSSDVTYESTNPYLWEFSVAGNSSFSGPVTVDSSVSLSGTATFTNGAVAKHDTTIVGSIYADNTVLTEFGSASYWQAQTLYIYDTVVISGFYPSNPIDLDGFTLIVQSSSTLIVAGNQVTIGTAAVTLADDTAFAYSFVGDIPGASPIGDYPAESNVLNSVVYAQGTMTGTASSGGGDIMSQQFSVSVSASTTPAASSAVVMTTANKQMNWQATAPAGGSARVEIWATTDSGDSVGQLVLVAQRIPAGATVRFNNLVAGPAYSYFFLVTLSAGTGTVSISGTI